MIYTEYFVKGTQPTTICPLHASPSFMDRLAGLFGKDGEKPVAADQAGLPPAGVSTTGATPPPAAPAVQPEEKKKDEKADEGNKKKRGFWSKLFGVGKDKDDKDKKNDKKKPGGGV
jgi:hypothetical protein